MILGGVKFKSGNMCARASTPPFIQRGRIVDRLYKLKYDAPFIPFWILTKDKRRYLIKRPQDLAFPPDRTGLLFVIWHGGKCTVLKFSQVSLLKPKTVARSGSSVYSVLASAAGAARQHRGA